MDVDVDGEAGAGRGSRGAGLGAACGPFSDRVELLILLLLREPLSAKTEPAESSDESLIRPVGIRSSPGSRSQNPRSCSDPGEQVVDLRSLEGARIASRRR